MATAAQPFPSLIVMRRGDRREQEWATVECKTKRAYGCGQVGQSVVDGLALLFRVAGTSDLCSDLAIHVSDDVFRLLGAEIPDEVAEDTGRQLRLMSKVETVDKSLIVFTVSFINPREFSFDYYLVYDSDAASLSMIPHLPRHCPASYTRRPFPVRYGDGGDYSLVLMATKFDDSGRDVLCLWTPPPPSLSVCGDVGPWKIKERCTPVKPRRFHADVAFSFKGKAFWADLARGVLYCDCSAVINGGDHVNFKFIELPPNYRLDDIQICETGPMLMSRTMGCVGNYIRFVSIGDLSVKPDEPEERCLGDTMVTVWTLDESWQQWSKDKELHVGSEIWGHKYFEQAELPKMVPTWPFLKEEEDGVLYFLLPKTLRLDGYYICSIDMRSKISRLLSRSLSISWIHRPVFLHSNFFKCLDPLDLRKRKLPAV